MTLKAALDGFRAEFLTKVPADIAATMQQATLQLAQDYAAKPLLQVGDRAPDFALPNALGKPIKLSDRVAQGYVVLTFYRGGWCPYCNLALRAYQQLLPQIQAMGASLMAISPQTPERSLTTVENNQLSFDVLSGRGSAIAQAYNIAYTLPDKLKEIYTQFDHALPDMNGSPDWQLPIPATFVIAPTGKILLAHVDADDHNRLEPEAALAIITRAQAMNQGVQV